MLSDAIDFIILNHLRVDFFTPRNPKEVVIYEERTAGYAPIAFGSDLIEAVQKAQKYKEQKLW